MVERIEVFVVVFIVGNFGGIKDRGWLKKQD